MKRGKVGTFCTERGEVQHLEVGGKESGNEGQGWETALIVEACSLHLTGPHGDAEAVFPLDWKRLQF